MRPPRLVQEGLELDLAVAQHVRVRRAARAVLGEEMFEDPVPVFAGEVARMEGDAELRADRQRVAAVVLGAAAAVAFLVPVLHEQARDRFARFLQQPRCDRGIHAAGQADDGAGGGHALSRPG
jgi:hypothetical protein